MPTPRIFLTVFFRPLKAIIPKATFRPVSKVPPSQAPLSPDKRKEVPFSSIQPTSTRAFPKRIPRARRIGETSKKRLRPPRKSKHFTFFVYIDLILSPDYYRDSLFEADASRSLMTTTVAGAGKKKGASKKTVQIQEPE